MYHNVERLEHKPLHNKHPVYRAWSVEGNKWDVRWNGSTWSASENEYPFRSARRGTLRQISEHLASLPQIKQQA